MIELVLNWNSFNTKSIIAFETPDTLYQQRFMKRVFAVIAEESVPKVIMQMAFLFYANPGIINFYQGSEYLEPDAMGDLPSHLAIFQKVGQLDGTTWTSKGDLYWFYHFTKLCLSERAILGLYLNTETSLFYRDDRARVMVFTMETQAGTRLLILHPSADLVDEQ